MDDELGNMVSIAATNGEQVSSEYFERDLAWSLKPILRMLQIYGTNLEVNEARSFHKRRAFSALGVLIFFSFCCVGYIEISYWINKYAREISTKSVYMILYRMSWITSSSLSMGAILMASQFKWKKLWKKLKEVEHFSCFTVNDYSKIRKVVITLILVAILQVFIVYQ